MKVKIQSVHFDADQKLKDFIEMRVEKLETYFDRIIDCDVTLRLDNKNTQIKDKVAVIKVQIPGNLLIGKSSTKLFEESVDEAVDSIRRQLRKYKEKMRAKV